MLNFSLALMLGIQAPGQKIDVRSRDAEGRTALYRISTAQEARALLEAGAEIEARDLHGETPLHWAAMTGADHVLDYLLSRGALVDARDDQGLTPLHWAVRRGSVDAAKSLLAKGADVNAQALNGLTPLHLAAGDESPDGVALLLQHGAQVDATDNKGQTPLFHAAAEGQRATMKVLLAKGADLNARDQEGHTPLALAIMLGRRQLARFMVSRGADPRAKNKIGKMPIELGKEAPEALAAFLSSREPPVAHFRRVWTSLLPEFFFPMNTGSGIPWCAVAGSHLFVAGMDMDLASGRRLRSLWKSTEGLDLEEVLPSGDSVLLLSRHAYHGDSHPGDFERMRRIENDRVLIARDIRTGRQRWRIHGQIPQGVAMVSGRAFLVRNDALLAVDVASGKTVWRTPRNGLHEGPVTSGQVVVLQESLEQEDTFTSAVQAFAMENGKPLWTAKLPGDARGAPAVGHGCVFVGREIEVPAAHPEQAPGCHYTLWALDEKTGEIRWQREFKDQTSLDPPAVSKGRVFTVTGKAIHALSCETGDPLWSLDIANEDVSRDAAPVFAEDLLLLWTGDLEARERSSSSPAAHLLALDAATGTIRWTFPFATEDQDISPSLSRPHYRKGTLIFSDGSKVYRMQRTAPK